MAFGILFLAFANANADSLNNVIDTSDIAIADSLVLDSNSEQPEIAEEVPTLLRKDAPKREVRSDNSIFYLFLGLFMLLAFILFNFRPYIRRLNKGIYNVKLTQQFYRDEYQGLGREIVLISIFILLIFTMATHFLFEYIGLRLNLIEEGQLYTLFILLFIFLMARYLIIRFVSWLFELENELGIYQFNFFQSAAILSMVLLPLLLALAFGFQWMKVPFLFIIVFLVIAWLIFGYTRGLSINSRYLSSNKFHFFIYLCALEIAPMVIFISIMRNFISV